jgi:CRISPR/Cas system CSM-associated protein Csm2 small subunit
MKPLLPLLLAAASLAADPTTDDLNRLDARELHNRGTRRLAEGDLPGAEEALRASLGRDLDALRPPTLHNLGHVRFGKGRATLGGKTAGDVTELSIARSYLEAADADIADMQDQITHLDDAKAAGKTPDYVPAVAALGQGIDTYRTVKKLIPKEEAMLAKRAGVVAAWTRSVGDFRGAHELDARDAESRANADAIDELLRALERETRQLAEAVEAQRRKQVELREVIKELIKRIPDDKLPQNAEGDPDDDENFLPEDRQKPAQGGPRKQREGDEQKMTEQEARGALEGLKNEFGRKMSTGDKPGAEGDGKPGKPNAKKGKDY